MVLCARKMLGVKIVENEMKYIFEHKFNCDQYSVDCGGSNDLGNKSDYLYSLSLNGQLCLFQNETKIFQARVRKKLETYRGFPTLRLQSPAKIETPCLLFLQVDHMSKWCFQVKIWTLFQVDIPNMLLPSPLAYSPKQDSIFIQQKPFTVSSFLQNTLAIMAESQKTKFVAQVDSIFVSFRPI